MPRAPEADAGGIPLDMLIAAYHQGAFPMADAADDARIAWVRPHVRSILPLRPFRVPRRLARTIRASDWTVTVDRAFSDVIRHCREATADRPDTWINRAILDAYGGLHHRGLAHSVEVWEAGRLIGGLYGLRLGAAFFGESMFSRATDASKTALVHLAGRLTRAGFVLLDAQFENPHLDQFGAESLNHDAYMARLDRALTREPDMAAFHLPLNGGQAVDYVRQSTIQAS